MTAAVLDLSVREFLALCRAHGLHFTCMWVEKRVRELDAVTMKSNAEKPR
jgi:hypothetical protein